MEHSSYQTRCFQFPDLLCDELLSFQSLLSDLLLDGPRMRTDSKVVLNHLPGNAGDVGCFPCKHIDIRPKEGDERVFLFAVEVELMAKPPPVPSSLRGTFLAFSGAALDFLLLPVELSGTSSTGAQHSGEVRLSEWVREVSSVFFPPGASMAGASALRQLLQLLAGIVGQRKSAHLSYRRGW